MAYIEIEVELDGFTLESLLDEIEYRTKRSNGDKIKVKEFVKAFIDGKTVVGSIADEMKLEYFLDNIDKFKLEDLVIITQNKN